MVERAGFDEAPAVFGGNKQTARADHHPEWMTSRAVACVQRAKQRVSMARTQFQLFIPCPPSLDANALVLPCHSRSMSGPVSYSADGPPTRVVATESGRLSSSTTHQRCHMPRLACQTRCCTPTRASLLPDGLQLNAPDEPSASLWRPFDEPSTSPSHLLISVDVMVSTALAWQARSQRAGGSAKVGEAARGAPHQTDR